MEKTHDFEYAFRGTWDKQPEGRCRVRILQQDGRPPTVILTELTSNPSTSVTNMVEILAAELIARHFPVRFEAVGEDPITLVEHYEPMVYARGRRGKPTYDRVEFGRWSPRKVWLGGQARLSLGEPDWRPLPDHEVIALIGGEADDLPQEDHRRAAPDAHLEAAYDDRTGGHDE
jgi:hypothetical protein